MTLFEYPLNERIRTLLRLENLFDRLAFFISQPHPLEHHVALTTLFEIADVASRADLKSDLLKELERQRQTLLSYRNNPAIDSSTLEIILKEVETGIADLGGIQGKVAQYILENEWLMSIRSRAIIPGGTCEFDLPAYHAWQRLPPEVRHRDIIKWITPLAPLKECMSLVLKLLRKSGTSSKVIAAAGSYQQMLSGKVFSLMQVRMDTPLQVIPEISANKYMVWVRFMMLDEDQKTKPTDSEIPFQLTLCNL